MRWFDYLKCSDSSTLVFGGFAVINLVCIWDTDGRLEEEKNIEKFKRIFLVFGIKVIYFLFVK